MEGLLPLAVLIGASGSLLAYTRASRRAQRGREGFDIVNPAVEKAFGGAHANYVRKGAEKYNPLMNIVNPKDNVLLPANFSPSDATITQQLIRRALIGAEAKATPLSRDLVPTKQEDILLNKDSQGTGLRAIMNCEKVKSSDCGAFDDSNFALNCGICVEGGRDSNGNTTLGGLFISEDDRLNAEAAAKRMGSRVVNYTPTVGKCDPNRFVTSKKQCTRLKAQLDCQKKQNFDVPGCSQCYQDEVFRYVDSEARRDEATLVVSGTGSLTVTVIGSAEPVKDYELNGGTQKIELASLMEGTVVELEIGDETAELAGYLVGTTPGGEFRTDIIRLVQRDAVTGSRPRVAGFRDINGESYTVMRPGQAKDSMKLQLLIPFTFLAPDEQEALDCGSAPYVAQQASARFLESSPCYKKGSGPGKYSLECLQQTFESVGCTAEGYGFPSNQDRANKLMVNGFGQALTIAQIADRIYTSFIAATTGKNKQGQSLSTEAWNNESQFCLGKTITSPCDIVDPRGQVSTDCLSYLWQNTGATDKKSSLGPTYGNGISTTSLNDKKQARYCTPNGTMAPVNKSGVVNPAAVAAARSKGSIANVKSFYDGIHKRANDNTLDDEERKEAIQQCYGIDLATPASNQPSDVKLADGCVPELLTTSMSNLKGGSVGDFIVNINSNFVCSMTVIPDSVGNVGFDYNIVNVGIVNVAYWVPSVCLVGGSNKVRAFVLDRKSRWEVTTNVSCPLNTPTKITVSLIDKVLSITIDGQQKETVSTNCDAVIENTKAKLAVGSFGWYPFSGTVQNIGYCSFAESKLISVLDNKAGRMKTATEPLPTVNVVEATYGYNCNARLRGNITSTVKGIADGKPSATVPFNNSTYGDPAPGCVKTGQVIYNCGDGVNRQADGSEWGSVNLTCGPVEQQTQGNNGTVSCNRYCSGVDGGPWNGELPASWGGAKCVRTTDPSVECGKIAGLRPQGIGCICAPDPKSGWNKKGYVAE